MQPYYREEYKMKLVHSNSFGSFYIADKGERIARVNSRDTIRRRELDTITKAMDLFKGEMVQFIGRKPNCISKAS